MARRPQSSFVAATAEYDDLCLVITHCVGTREEQPTDFDLPTRLLAARGLFRHNRDHLVARDLLARQGDERDRAAVVRARHQAASASRKER